MDFELTMRLLFGDKAYQVAVLEANPEHRREWLQKTVRKLLRLTDTIDAPPRLKADLMFSLNKVSSELKPTESASWELVYCLVNLTLRLYGFRFSGARCYSLAYWQTLDQQHTEVLFAQTERARSDDAISLRRQVVEALGGDGVDDFTIALVLNVSEYAVKQLRSDPRLKSARKRRAPSKEQKAT